MNHLQTKDFLLFAKNVEMILKNVALFLKWKYHWYFYKMRLLIIIQLVFLPDITHHIVTMFRNTLWNNCKIIRNIQVVKFCLFLIFFHSVVKDVFIRFLKYFYSWICDAFKLCYLPWCCCRQVWKVICVKWVVSWCNVLHVSEFFCSILNLRFDICYDKHFFDYRGYLWARLFNLAC